MNEKAVPPRILGDTLARGLVKQQASTVEDRLNRVVDKAIAEGSQRRGAQFRRVLEALIRAGSVLLAVQEASKHNSHAFMLAPTVDGPDGRWDLLLYETSRRGNNFVRTDCGITVHASQRALQSGLSLKDIGSTLLRAMAAEEAQVGTAKSTWCNGWFASDISLIRIDENLVVTVIAIDVLEASKGRLYDRAISLGGWLRDESQPPHPDDAAP